MTGICLLPCAGPGELLMVRIHFEIFHRAVSAFQHVHFRVRLSVYFYERQPATSTSGSRQPVLQPAQIEKIGGVFDGIMPIVRLRKFPPVILNVTIDKREIRPVVMAI